LLWRGDGVSDGGSSRPGKDDEAVHSVASPSRQPLDGDDSALGVSLIDDDAEDVDDVRTSTVDAFIRRSRFVVLAAHRLVYDGDVIARHVADQSVGDRIAAAANELCNQLQLVVMATGNVALATGDNQVSTRWRLVVGHRGVPYSCLQRHFRFVSAQDIYRVRTGNIYTWTVC